MKISIAFQTNKRLADYGELAELVERYPFDTISLYEDLMFQPAWQPLLVMAQHTRRVRLGVAVVNPYLRHPAVIAGEFALLNEAARGRAYLGLGRGAFLEALQIEQRAPLAMVREAIEVIQRLLRGEGEPFAGRYFKLTAQATLRWQPPYGEAPLLIGAWGPRMAALAGKVAQEVKVGGSCNPDFAPLMRRYIARGAREVGRDADEVGIVFGAVSVVAEDRAAAEALARREVAMYLPVVLSLDPTLQVDEAELRAVQAAIARNDAEGAAAALGRQTLRKLAFFGTPEDIIEQVEALAAAGVTRVELGTPHGQDEAAAIRLLGERVAPYFASEAPR